MYVLRKINEDGKHYNFKWPMEINTIVECPDWNPEPQCGNGFHGLLEGNGSWSLLQGFHWAILDVDEQDIIDLDDKVKFSKCKIVHIGDKESMQDHVDKFPNLNSINAYQWALNIGNNDVMIDKITRSYDAYWWAIDIGDREVMRDRVTDSYFRKLFNNLK